MRIATRRLRWLVVIALVLPLVGCIGDPGIPSSDVALAMTSDGDLMLMVNMCGPLASIEIGDGTDRWAKAASVIVPRTEVTGGLRIILDPLSDSYSLKRGSRSLSKLSVPLFVRAIAGGTDSGVWADQSFDRLPGPGTAIFIPKNSKTDKNEVHDISEFPAKYPDCAALE